MVESSGGGRRYGFGTQETDSSFADLGVERLPCQSWLARILGRNDGAGIPPSTHLHTWAS